MKIEYDKQEDILYLLLRRAKPYDTVDIEEGVTVDLDAEGHIVGIEILDACDRLGTKSLRSITVEDIPLRMTARRTGRLVKPGAG